jgi:hypothetical protein
MGGNSFLNAFMPTLPWWFLCLVLLALCTWLAGTLVKMMNARRHQAERPVKALRQARDALAAVISDPFTGHTARDQAVAAYQAVTEALTKESSN